eukprot:1160582-Pelagomonas_calceolata.AAC.1
MGRDISGGIRGAMPGDGLNGVYTLKVLEEHAVQPYMAAQQRTKKSVHDLSNGPDALPLRCMTSRNACVPSVGYRICTRRQ